MTSCRSLTADVGLQRLGQWYVAATSKKRLRKSIHGSGRIEQCWPRHGESHRRAAPHKISTASWASFWLGIAEAVSYSNFTLSTFWGETSTPCPLAARLTRTPRQAVNGRRDSEGYPQPLAHRRRKVRDNREVRRETRWLGDRKPPGTHLPIQTLQR
jgi:hypothetical protein